MKNEILIAESVSHLKVLSNLYRLITNNCASCNLTFCTNKEKIGGESKETLFPEYGVVDWVTNPLHNVLFHCWIVFVGWKYKLINISTGPEGNHWSDSINVLFFYIGCVIYGKKTILTVKNTRSYLKSTPGILSFVRNTALKHIRGFTFETETMRDVFHEETNIDINKLGVSYDRYTDLNIVNIKTADIETYAEYSCVIGLLGGVHEHRRNYDDIIGALKKLPSEKRKKLLFVTLGNTPNGSDNAVIKKLKEWTNVDYKDGWLTAEEFEIRGLSCDVLISPLRKAFEYGTYKGSGSFGDAVLLRKKIIIPDFIDPRYEFADISIYYGRDIDLSSVFENIFEYINEKTPDEYYSKFTTKSVYKNLVNDLSLNVFCDSGK